MTPRVRATLIAVGIIAASLALTASLALFCYRGFRALAAETPETETRMHSVQYPYGHCRNPDTANPGDNVTLLIARCNWTTQHDPDQKVHARDPR
jgi:hypothetical protein